MRTSLSISGAIVVCAMLAFVASAQEREEAARQRPAKPATDIYNGVDYSDEPFNQTVFGIDGIFTF